MNLLHDLESTVLKVDITESSKGLNPFGDFSCCILKKCCKKYKKGKRCSKCPNR